MAERRKKTAVVGWALAVFAAGLFAWARLHGMSVSEARGTRVVRRSTVTPTAYNTNVNVDPGTPLGGHAAPAFTLVNQFGRRVSLSNFRGKVVLLAFLDSHCTTICPLTTVEMVRARAMLGPGAQSEVALVGINANPDFTSVGAVRAYSAAHGLLHRWTYLTGTLPALERVWRAYGVSVAILKGAIDHTPAVYLIDAQGREERVYMTQLAYTAVGQQSQVFANALARLLPRPTPQSASLLRRSLVPVPTALMPGQVPMPLAWNPRIGRSGGSLTIEPGRPVLLVFFASWLSELSDVPKELAALNTYEAAAVRDHLPSLVAIDEAPTEPSSTSLTTLLDRTPRLAYPVAVDSSGRLADSLGVQDLTWYVLLGPEGRILWTHDGSNLWVSPQDLVAQVRLQAKAWSQVPANRGRT